LTDEFSNVDLESMTEEEDPPSFKAARKKDKERLQSLEQNGILEHGNQNFIELGMFEKIILIVFQTHFGIYAYICPFRIKP
jgi:hypothetical protein